MKLLTAAVFAIIFLYSADQLVYGGRHTTVVTALLRQVGSLLGAHAQKDRFIAVPTKMSRS